MEWTAAMWADNRMGTLTVVVPAFNEADALCDHLDRWLTECAARQWHLIVVDDGSRDTTHEVLEARLTHPRLRVFRHRRNRGYGNAIKTGVLHATTPFVGTMDADGQHSITDLGILLDEAERSEADLVIGSRSHGGESGLYRRAGKSILRWMARLLFAIRLHDLNSGMKVYRTSLVRSLLEYCPGSMAFSDVVTLTHLNLGYSVVEVPIQVQNRRSGSSTINTMTAADTLLEIVNVMMWFRPLRIFIPLALILAAMGVAWAIPLLAIGRGLSSVSLLLLLAGMIVGVLGLLAEQLASGRRAQMPEVEAIELLHRK